MVAAGRLASPGLDSRGPLIDSVLIVGHIGGAGESADGAHDNPGLVLPLFYLGRYSEGLRNSLTPAG